MAERIATVLNKIEIKLDKLRTAVSDLASAIKSKDDPGIEEAVEEIIAVDPEDIAGNLLNLIDEKPWAKKTKKAD